MEFSLFIICCGTFEDILGIQIALMLSLQHQPLTIVHVSLSGGCFYSLNSDYLLFYVHAHFVLDSHIETTSSFVYIQNHYGFVKYVQYNCTANKISANWLDIDEMKFPFLSVDAFVVD